MILTNRFPIPPSDPARAAELLRVIESEARWVNLKDTGATSATGVGLPALQDRQRAYEAFRVRLIAFRAKDEATYEPEPLLNDPKRLAGWCRAMRDLCRAAATEMETETPRHIMEKAHRAAARAATRADVQPYVSESSPASTGSVADELDVLARWCDGLPLVEIRRRTRIPA